MRMQREKHKAVWMRMLAEREISLRRDSKKLLKSQGKSSANSYKKHPSVATVEEVLKKGQGQWNRTLVEHYTKVIKQFSDYTNEQLMGGKSQKRNFSTRVQDFIKKQGVLKSKYITDTTIDKARQIISDGHKDGKGETEIGDDLEHGIGGAVSDYRADRIARTEVHNAATYGMQETAEDVQDQTGLGITKEWVAIGDERTREAHAEADGQEVDLEDTFDVDGESLDRPGDDNGSPENVINCRCSLVYHTSSGEEVDEGEVEG